MVEYPKKILTVQQQIQAYIDSGMTVSSIPEAEKTLTSIGYYRLRGYCFHRYNSVTKKYQSGTDFSDVLKLYYFDTELSHLLLSMTSHIEIALRVRLNEALLVYEDPLILFDPSAFASKKELLAEFKYNLIRNSSF